MSNIKKQRNKVVAMHNVKPEWDFELILTEYGEKLIYIESRAK